MNYYNENDPKAAAWLRELIKAKLIPDGDVDERSIVDVKPHELTRYTQQHFFAGIGGWSLALELAGWPEDKPVRTGSCPCQPFSITGKKLGTKDERHLWPVFRDLISFGEPTITFGEQVASPLGREWLAGVRADLEGLGYRFAAADLPAASVGKKQARQRFFWVAHAQHRRLERGRGVALPVSARERRSRIRQPIASGVQIEAPEMVAHERAVTRCEWPGKPEPTCLVDGIPARVVRVRGYGNAIVPQVAAEFIQAAVEAIT